MLDVMSMSQFLRMTADLMDVIAESGAETWQAERLVAQRIHPMTIIAGYREAVTVSRDYLEGLAMDNGEDPVAFRNDLLRIAKTTLSSKILTQDKVRRTLPDLKFLTFCTHVPKRDVGIRRVVLCLDCKHMRKRGTTHLRLSLPLFVCLLGFLILPTPRER